MSISVFSTEFLEHLAAELGCETSDIEKAISSFGEAAPAPKPVKPARKRVPAKAKASAAKKKANSSSGSASQNESESESEDSKPSASESDDEKHTCDRVPRGKTDPCGKNAKNKVDDEGSVFWYCGTERSGCYKSILLAQKRQKKVAASKPKGKAPAKKAPAPKTTTKPKAKKPTTNAGRKTASDTKSKSLVHKVTKRQKLDIKKVKVGGKVLWVDSQSRVLFDRATQEAYGVLAKDNKTTEPLSEENIRWLEASGVAIRTEAETGKKGNLKKKLSKKGADDVDDDEELDKLRGDVEDADTGADDEEDIDLGGSEDEEDLGSEEDIDLGSDDEIDLGSDDDIDLGSDDEDD